MSLPILKQFILLTFFTLHFCAFAEIQSLESRIWQRARALPAGQQLWSAQSAYRKSTQRFSDTGTLQPLGRRYARATTWGDLLASTQGAPSVNAAINEHVKNNNLKMESVAAVSQYEVQREETILQLNWAYGLTSSWMIGLELPFVWSTTRVNSQVELTSSLNGLVAAQGSGHSPEDMRAQVKSAAAQELSNSGFDNVPDQKQVFEAGDISIFNQFLVLKTYAWTWALQQNLRFPTSRNQSSFEYIQLSRDEGQTDFGLTNIMDWRLGRWLLGAKAGYVVQAPDTTRVRTAKVQRDLGDYYTLGLDGEVRWARRWSVSGGYSYLNKERDKYSGEFNAFAAQTEQELHQSRVGVDYLLDFWGVRQGIEEKWQLSFNYYAPIAGRNSVDGSRSSLELIGYF